MWVTHILIKLVTHVNGFRRQEEAVLLRLIDGVERFSAVITRLLSSRIFTGGVCIIITRRSVVV